MSTNHTPNYQLSQWEPSDQFSRTEFNADNAKLDAALTGLSAQIAEKAAASVLEQLRAEVSALPRLITGTYTGDGAATRVIDLGFQPKLVLVCSDFGGMFQGGGNRLIHGGMALPGQGLATPNARLPALHVVASGFQVYYRTSSYEYAETNTSGTVYLYAALK